MSDGEDDFPKLSTDTLKALQEFYDDKAEKDRKLNEQLIDGENPSGSFDFDEDWVSPYHIYLPSKKILSSAKVILSLMIPSVANV